MDHVENYTVMQFDICSSSTIMKSLILSSNVQAWVNLLMWIKEYLIKTSVVYDFIPYKFMGDGWVLLFDFDPARRLFNFAKEFSNHFAEKMQNLITDYLEVEPKIVGITFGVDKSPLIKINNDPKEYSGWALNVSARLVKARNGDKTPQYKLLMTKSVYKDLEPYIKGYPAKSVIRTLKNILDSPFHCVSMRVKEL